MATNDPASRIEDLVRRTEPEIRAAFLSLVIAVRDELDLDRLADQIERGLFNEAFDEVRRALGRMNLAWTNSFVRAGRETGQFLTTSVQDVVIDFDQVNSSAVRQMQDANLRTIQEFTEQQRRATQRALVDGIRTGANPRAQARAIRDSIGLTEMQQGHVISYRRALENLDRNALTRRLRDRRFDGTVRRAITSQEQLSSSQIDRMVERYRQRFIAHRAEVIARTESLKAVHQGVDEMYRQAVEAGEIQPDQLVRIWNTAADERVRDFSTGSSTSHRTMHLQERGVDEPFTSGAGNQSMHPGAFGVGEEDILCRCAVSTRILTLDELRDAGAQVFVLSET